MLLYDKGLLSIIDVYEIENLYYYELPSILGF